MISFTLYKEDSCYVSFADKNTEGLREAKQLPWSHKLVCGRAKTQVQVWLAPKLELPAMIPSWCQVQKTGKEINSETIL